MSRAVKIEKESCILFYFKSTRELVCTVNLTVQGRVKKWHALVTLSVSSICTNMNLRAVTLPPGVVEAEEITFD